MLTLKTLPFLLKNICTKNKKISACLEENMLIFSCYYADEFFLVVILLF